MPIAPGTRLGQYEVQDFIGQGAMGLVYRAYHPQLERTGAVKVMQAISPDVDTVTRFRHEAQAIAKLRHPNIVDVYDFGEFQGTPYMIVEYVPGGSLAAKMSRGKLDRATAVRYLRGIAAGLDYAHSHGVVHRDVKPANVLLTADDTPVLADFGLAKLLQGSSLKSMTGVTTGTPAYMAPEQVAGRQVGPPADMYSLSTIAYEMLTGVIPFDGEALMELLYAQVHREPVPPSSRYPDLGREVDAVIMRGLAKNPADRWQTCTAFADALDAAMKGEPAPAPTRTLVMPPPVLASTVPLAPPPKKVAARPAPGTVVMPFPAPAPAAPTAPLAAGAGAGKPKRRLDRRMLIGVAALLVLVVAFGLCTIASAATTLVVSPNIASPGEVVNVTAANVPANQTGLIELHSTIHTFGFRADSTGHVNSYVTVPRDIALGDHTIKICWAGTCHASASLRVVGSVALESSTPIAHATPSPTTPGATPGSSPTSTPPPGSTPQPTSPPTSNPKPSPTPPPPPPPASPSPTPPPNPCPTSSQAASVTTSPGTVVAGLTTVMVSGQNFTPNRFYSVVYIAPNGARRTVGSGTVACNGTLSASFTPGVLDIGTGQVVANDAGGRFASHSFQIAA